MISGTPCVPYTCRCKIYIYANHKKKKNEKDCYISKDIVATVLGVSNECWSVHTNRTRAPADGNHSTPGKNACPEFVSARYTVQYIISIRKMLHMYLVMYVRHLCLYFISLFGFDYMCHQWSGHHKIKGTNSVIRIKTKLNKTLYFLVYQQTCRQSIR